MIALVLFIGASVASFLKGEQYEHTRSVAAQTVAVDQAVSEAKANAAIDYGVQQQLALEAQARELTHQQKSHSVAVAVAADRSAADCKLGAPAYGVLLDSLDSSNADSAATPGAGNGPVSAGDAAGRPDAGSSGVRTGQHGVDPLDVQSGAQATH
ncbi:hypothetical protein FSB65_35625 [Paraburkholderia sp. JPY418]|uniref:hypothetical protein n=1 Tax=Paraburkholderia youngii TaxID=2782701 RepID=UPI0015920C24|nr:hypothetical protein [Paraburkholderia youngii]NUX58647.1 hypothetical protein [Paraburkholderia youngii]